MQFVSPNQYYSAHHQAVGATSLAALETSLQPEIHNHTNHHHHQHQGNNTNNHHHQSNHNHHHPQSHHHLNTGSGNSNASSIGSASTNLSNTTSATGAITEVDQHPSHHHHHLHHQFGGHQTIDSTTLSSTQGQSKKSIDKGSDEYKKRRERNNVAVRKSREKAKLRSRETERRVAELSKENQYYRAQYDELRREFDVLKSLLLKTGLTEQVIEDEAQRHSMQQQMNQVSNSVHNHMALANNHHIVSSLSNHVIGPKGSLGCNQISATTNQAQYTTTTGDSLDQWTDGISAYVEDWAS